MLNFSDTMTFGDARITGTASANHTPGTLHILGAVDLSASLRADSYTSAL